jgi:hypothetical protein
VCKYLKYLVFCFCLLLQGLNVLAQAPTNKADARVEKIRKELNAFKIPSALQQLNNLMQKYPRDTYLNELQITIRQQILDRILYARSETGIEELSFLKRDSSWEKRPVVSWDDTGASISDETYTAEDVIKKSKSKKKKEAEVQLWDDLIPTENPDVFIDSSLLNDQEYERNLALNAPEKSEEELKSTSRQERIAERQRKLEAKRQEILQSYSALSYEAFKSEILQLANFSTLYIEHADSASALIRRGEVDSAFFNKKYNTNVQELLDVAAEDEQDGDIEAALVHYNAALELEPTMYFAYIKMATLYAAAEEDSMAVVYYDAAKLLEVEKPDAYYECAQYYYKKASYLQATENILEAIMRYPEKKYFGLVELIHLREAKVFTSNWVARDVFPIVSAQNMDALVVDKNNSWYWYQAARAQVQDYMNLDGTLKANDTTREKYTEVYAWGRMLDSCTDQTKFPFARAMRKIGYLDCYVFLSTFHHYLHPQFKIFTAQNRKKMEAYFLILLGWEKPKFDYLKPKPLTAKKKK